MTGVQCRPQLQGSTSNNSNRCNGDARRELCHLVGLACQAVSVLPINVPLQALDPQWQTKASVELEPASRL